MLDTTQNVTVSGTTRTYTTVWDQEFAKDLATGSTSVRKAPITNGNSILKISHAESKGVERHQVFLRDKIIVDGAVGQEQAHIVITCAADDPSSVARAKALAVGLCSECVSESGELLDDVLAGQL